MNFLATLLAVLLLAWGEIPTAAEVHGIEWPKPIHDMAMAMQQIAVAFTAFAGASKVVAIAAVCIVFALVVSPVVRVLAQKLAEKWK